MTAAEWADAMLARGNARGRIQRELDDPDQDANPRGTHSRFDVDESRVVIVRCVSCGTSCRGSKDGYCGRCRSLKERGKIK